MSTSASFLFTLKRPPEELFSKLEKIWVDDFPDHFVHLECFNRPNLRLHSKPMTNVPVEIQEMIQREANRALIEIARQVAQNPAGQSKTGASADSTISNGWYCELGYFFEPSDTTVFIECVKQIAVHTSGRVLYFRNSQMCWGGETSPVTSVAVQEIVNRLPDADSREILSIEPTVSRT